MRHFFTALVSLCLALPATAPAQTHADAPSVETRAVLVTGASTGIGRKITEHLAARGYFVYAGARKQADLDALGAIKNVQRREARRHQAGRHRRGGRHHHEGRSRALRAGQQRRHRDAWARQPKPPWKSSIAHGRERVRPVPHGESLHAADHGEQGPHHQHRFDLRRPRIERPFRLCHEQTCHRSVHGFARAADGAARRDR